jgi:hypothetical protein
VCITSLSGDHVDHALADFTTPRPVLRLSCIAAGLPRIDKSRPVPELHRHSGRRANGHQRSTPQKPFINEQVEAFVKTLTAHHGEARPAKS